MHFSNLSRCVEFLSGQNQAHNVFITRAQPIRTVGPIQKEDVEQRPQFVTAYVFPRANALGAKPPRNFSPAANELAGRLTSYTMRFFESASEQSIVRIIEEEAQIPTQVFRRLASDFSDLLSDRPLGTSHRGHSLPLEDLTSLEVEELRDFFQTFTPFSPDVNNRIVRNQRSRSIPQGTTLKNNNVAINTVKTMATERWFERTSRELSPT
ncbi:hypothetical protein DICVIV_00037 [Dictyocaulus viviparus]|uniref:GDP-D-glucose phosphorylase 1 n=1 Tax=Dictyocaulus viviparus TaxID=29172 RepID=A0A0D8YC27_DICVI|nr:hypothetical protein DICVIV_00037 [Dictyocaulus viviparus]